MLYTAGRTLRPSLTFHPDSWSMKKRRLDANRKKLWKLKVRAGKCLFVCSLRKSIDVFCRCCVRQKMHRRSTLKSFFVSSPEAVLSRPRVTTSCSKERSKAGYLMAWIRDGYSRTSHLMGHLILSSSDEAVYGRFMK